MMCYRFKDNDGIDTVYDEEMFNEYFAGYDAVQVEMIAAGWDGNYYRTPDNTILACGLCGTVLAEYESLNEAVEDMGDTLF